MPIRLLRPEILTSEAFNRLDWFYQALWYRLLSIADDYGRHDARPLVLCALGFPLRKDVTEEDVVGGLAQLQANGLVRLYTVEGKPFVQLLKWRERIRSPSKCPEPPVARTHKKQRPGSMNRAKAKPGRPPKPAPHQKKTLCGHLTADLTANDSKTANGPHTGAGELSRAKTPSITASQLSSAEAVAGKQLPLIPSGGVPGSSASSSVQTTSVSNLCLCPPPTPTPSPSPSPSPERENTKGKYVRFGGGAAAAISLSPPSEAKDPDPPPPPPPPPRPPSETSPAKGEPKSADPPRKPPPDPASTATLPPPVAVMGGEVIDEPPPPNVRLRLERLHQWFCDETRQRINFLSAARLWWAWANEGFSDDELNAVVIYLDRQIRQEKRNPGALKLRNLLDPQGFEADLNMVRRHSPRLLSPIAGASSASVRLPPEPEPVAVKRTPAERERISTMLSDLRHRVSQPRPSAQNEASTPAPAASP